MNSRMGVSRTILWGILGLSAVLVQSRVVQALDNGLAMTPPMGWNSWNAFHCNIDETLIRQTADAMVTSGMKDAGYEFVNLDDCWQIARDVNDVIVADATDFPSGIADLADYVHVDGLKLGLYSDHGTQTCAKRPGSYSYETIDANTYAAWGVDYLKYDNCNIAPGSDQQTDYEVMRDALGASGHPIVFSICAWTYKDWMPVTGNLWRTTGDISDNWSSMVSKLDTNNRSAFSAGPGRWNDPDMMEIGNGGMTDTEYRSHFSMWCIAAAPLLAGNDVRSMSQATIDILTAPEVIAVDQDSAGIQGIRLSSAAGVDGNLEVWSKPVGDTFTARVVALFNRSSQAADITVDWNSIGLAGGNAVVRDLWAQANVGVFANSYTANVPSHGVHLVRIDGAAPSTAYVSDQHFHSADNGWGPVERDTSNGENAPYNGNTITLNGVTYSKGLGVHAPSRLLCYLDGKVQRFQSDIGVDDEVTGSAASVIFRVWDGATLLYDSGVMTATSATQSIDLDVTGKTLLSLEVTDAGDGKNSDHADWAGAQLLLPPTAACSISVPSDTIATSYVDGPNPADATVDVQNSGIAPASYTIVEMDENQSPADVPWLSLDKLSGGPISVSGSDTVTLSFDMTGLAVGTYTAFLQFADNCDPVNTILHEVTLRVMTPPGASAACYRFDDGTANDSSGNGNDGTLHNGASIVNDPNRGNVLELDGVDDYVDLGTDPSLDLSDDGQASIVAWVKMAASQNHNTILTKGEWKDAYSLLIKGDVGDLLWTGNDTSVFSAGAIPAGVWTHVAVVINGNLATFYINGQVNGTADQDRGGPIDNNPADHTEIGREDRSDDGTGARWYFNGRMDDVCLFGTALCQKQIVKIMNGNPDGDIDGDGHITLADFSYVNAQWASDGSADPSADISPSCGDNMVNMQDLLLMTLNFLELN